MSQISTTQRLDIINLGLLVFSCAIAFILPFEVFFFAYAILGPLHYLTEISWLHDKKYYTTGNRDFIFLIVISIVLTIIYLLVKHNSEFLYQYFTNQEVLRITGHLSFIAFGSALFFAFIKNRYIKIAGIIGIVLMTLVSSYFVLFFTLFLPTLVHVFIFTSFFMLYGALKSRSKTGYLNVALHILCPFLLFYLFPSVSFSTDIGIKNYIESDLSRINKFLFLEYFNTTGATGLTPEKVVAMVFKSQTGIAIMRFISFAYLYHYLNWFSKTEIIRWHKVPKSRFILVIALWITSLVIYSIDYAVGLQWLYFLSFLHVFLEFPLNYISFAGIFTEVRSRIFQPAYPALTKSQARKASKKRT